MFDVGHQAYAHKMLTGRLEAMRESLREEGGVSGFPRALESDCDAFTAGHASRPFPRRWAWRVRAT